MSWWLSKPVQARLHQMLECGYNYRQLKTAFTALGLDPKGLGPGRTNECDMEEQKAAR
jgi:hypothetical protein